MGGGSPQEKTSRQRRISRTCEAERREPYASVGRKSIGYREMNGNNGTITVVEVFSVHSVIYIEIHIQSSFRSTCPEKIRGHDRHLPVVKSGSQFVESTIGISQVSRREHTKFFFFFFFFKRRSMADR